MRLGFSRNAIRYSIADDRIGSVVPYFQNGLIINKLQITQKSRISNRSPIIFKYAKHTRVFVKKNTLLQSPKTISPSASLCHQHSPFMLSENHPCVIKNCIYTLEKHTYFYWKNGLMLSGRPYIFHQESKLFLLGNQPCENTKFNLHEYLPNRLSQTSQSILRRREAEWISLRRQWCRIITVLHQ